MRNITMSRWSNLRRTALGLLGASAAATLGVLLGAASPAAAAEPTIDLYAVPGSTTLPNGTTVDVLGYNTTNAPVDKPGGPVIVVNQGDLVTITLHNELGTGADTSLLIKGQPLVPDLVGAADAGTATYTFTADEPGTFLYEAGLLPNTEYQTAMGLHGAFVVQPTSAPDVPIANQAYGDASTSYAAAAVLVLSELDPNLNNAADPAAFDMRNYKPRFFLVDGKAHPQIDTISAPADADVLLRYVNAGVTNHSMGVLGASGQTVIAMDGFPLNDTRTYVAETIGPGQTLDALVHTPATGPVDQRLSVYDAGMRLRNANADGLGGMLATLQVDGVAPGADDQGPVSSGAAWLADTLTAHVSDANRGGHAITEARAYFDDLTTAPIGLAAADGTFDSADEDVTGSVPVVSGEHTIYVQGFDGTTWGPLTSVLVTGADAGGPTVVGPVVNPDVTRQAAPKDVTVTATGDDSASGNSQVTAAQYSIGTSAGDGGWVDMDVTNPAPVAELTGTIPTTVLDTLTEGSHPVWVRAQDAQGNWGDAVSVNLDVDLSAPAVGPVVVEKSPNNGLIPLTSSQPVVRVSVQQISDVAAGYTGTIDKVEMYVDENPDTVVPPATAFAIPMTSLDGLFNEQAEGAYGDIPLSTVRQMGTGNHTIYVRARDRAGNWSSYATGTLVVDTDNPVVDSLSITPSPTQGTTATLAATVSDVGTGVVAAEWWVGTASPGTGTPLTVTGGTTINETIDLSLIGDRNVTVKVRVQDAAGNWSGTKTTSVDVTPQLWFSTAGDSNPSPLTNGGSGDRRDAYFWNGVSHTRELDLSGLTPGNANLDGFQRLGADHYLLSFAPSNVALPGGPTVQDEDIVEYDGGAWTVWFDGTAHGLTTGAEDIDAFHVTDVDNQVFYFSTRGNVRPPNVGGAPGDNADIYRYNGTGNDYSRVWDATQNGIAGNENVDGLVWRGNNDFYVSFDTTTNVPGLGNTPENDVVHKYGPGASWVTYFDGSRHGVTGTARDVDAIDIP